MHCENSIPVLIVIWVTISAFLAACGVELQKKLDAKKLPRMLAYPMLSFMWGCYAVTVVGAFNMLPAFIAGVCNA